jgi:hypothetical protein
MIIMGGRTRSVGGRSHWPAPGAPGFLGACMADPAGRAAAVTGSTARSSAVAIGHGSIPGSARRLDMRS